MTINLRDIPVLIITLPGQPRRAITEKMLHYFPHSEVVYSVSTPDNYIRGCALGHIAALNKAIDPPYTNSPVLILEDDADFTWDGETPPGAMELSLPHYTEAVYLGLSRWGYKKNEGAGNLSHKPFNSELTKLNSMLATHAILYTSLSYKLYSLNIAEECIRTNTPLDIPLAQNMESKQVFARRMPLFYQNDNKNKAGTLFAI